MKKKKKSDKKMYIPKEILQKYFFNTFHFNVVENSLRILFLCLFVRSLNHVSILYIQWNSYIYWNLLMECLILKMKCIVIVIRLQEHAKEFRHITMYGGKSFAVYFSGIKILQIYWNLHITEVHFKMLTIGCSVHSCLCRWLSFFI